MNINEMAKSFVPICKQMIHNGDEIENILSHLRQAGCSKLMSVKVLAECTDLPISKAKEIVHSSLVWSDRYENDEAFQDQLASALKQLTDE